MAIESYQNSSMWMIWFMGLYVDASDTLTQQLAHLMTDFMKPIYLYHCSGYSQVTTSCKLLPELALLHT